MESNNSEWQRCLWQYLLCFVLSSVNNWYELLTDSKCFWNRYNAAWSFRGEPRSGRAVLIAAVCSVRELDKQVVRSILHTHTHTHTKCRVLHKPVSCMFTCNVPLPVFKEKTNQHKNVKNKSFRSLLISVTFIMKRSPQNWLIDLTQEVKC